MKQQSLPKRMISAVTAAVLAFTMVPISSAMAVEGGAESEVAATPSSQNYDVDLLAVDPINVTVPVVVTFGGAEGYDLANPSPSIEENFKFQNQGNTALMVSAFTVTGAINGTDAEKTEYFTSIFKPVNEAHDDAEHFIFNQNYKNFYSLYPSDRPELAINMDASSSNSAIGFDGTGTKYDGSLFLIGAKGQLECTWRLNLTNADESQDYDKLVGPPPTSPTQQMSANRDIEIRPEVADGEFHALNKITYTISTYTPAGSLTVRNSDGTIDEAATNANLEENSAFYLIDNSTNECYSLNDVKNHSSDLSKKGKNSVYYGMYMNYIKDESAYECRTTWGTTWKVPNEIKGIAEPDTATTEEELNVQDSIRYDLDIVGLLHDDKADGTGKAGLTFQFSGLLYSDAALDNANDRKRNEFTDVDNDGIWTANEDNGYPDGSTWYALDQSDGWIFWPRDRNNNGDNPTWRTSITRSELNPPSMQYSSKYSDIANSRIWNKIPPVLQANMVSVNKATVEWSNKDFALDPEISVDKVFLASAHELLGDAGIQGTENANSLSKEGYQYEYYKVHSVQNNVSNAMNEPLQRYYLNEDGTIYSGSKTCTWENHRSAASASIGSRLLYQRKYQNGSASSLSRVNLLYAYSRFTNPIAFSPMFCL